MADHVVCFSTVDSEEKAADIARTLVSAGLCACVNLVPVARSIYMWQGKLCEDPEILCVLKTRKDRVDELKQKLSEIHPYDCPELIVLDVVDGHGPYLKWLDESTRSS